MLSEYIKKFKCYKRKYSFNEKEGNKEGTEEFLKKDMSHIENNKNAYKNSIIWVITLNLNEFKNPMKSQRVSI